jgi:hypothetical protein
MKQTMKMQAKQELTKMVRARTFMNWLRESFTNGDGSA